MKEYMKNIGKYDVLSKVEETELANNNDNASRDKLIKHNLRLVIYWAKKYNYRDMHLLSNRLANGLIKLGMKKGDGVAVFQINTPEFIFALFSTYKIGGYTVLVNTAVKVLEIGEVCREQLFDYPGINIRKATHFGHHTSKENNCQVGLIRRHPWVTERSNLIGGGCQTHHTLLMEITLLVNIALGQSELKLGL